MASLPMMLKDFRSCGVGGHNMVLRKPNLEVGITA
jgi:hypothetical protein